MPLSEDLIRELQGRPILPDDVSAAQFGTYVTLDGFDEEGFPNYALTGPPDPQVLSFHGDPTGSLIAKKGTLAVDVDTPALYQNTDGQDAWTDLSGSSGSFTPGFDTFVDTSGVTYPGSQYAMEWIAVFGDGLIVPDVDGSSNFVGRVTAAGFYTVSANALQWASPFSDQQFNFVMQVYRSGSPINLSSPVTGYSFAANGFGAASPVSVVAMPLQVGDFIYALVEASGTDNYGLSANVGSLT